MTKPSINLGLQLPRCIGVIGLLLAFVTVGKAQGQGGTALMHRAEKNLTRTIVRDIFSPPVASRVYLYANVAAYEVLVLGDTSYHSLQGQIGGFPAIEPPEQTVDLPLAALYAFWKTGAALVFSEKILDDSLQVILKERVVPDSVTYAHSIRFGERVSRAILEWASSDFYAETRKKRRYRYAKQPGKWTPTPPAYMDAIEPNWNMIRPVALDSASQFKPAPPPAFSLDTTSRFMQEVYEVYRVTQRLDPEQVAVASFWDCNPFFLNTQGHLNFATKKLSPGGHWMSIAGQVAQSAHLGWTATSATYLMTSIALFDGFISCWDEKYRSQLIRPETFINAHIDESWRPALQTPPFPEYTSGHSVISTAAAVVLTALIGDDHAFDDHTEVEYGLPVRSFTSFRHACNEAAISRLYGGIHYRSAIEQGQLQGDLVGRQVLEKIRLKSNISLN
ncbi:PAP2 superfamily protein [Dyadobacter jejuensis]|uniref:PAP2 superfamily protein n=1 Tax=Dyadobacter jejuensis TaxID=1082580 RepID=A0A316AR46_9BACT|nr:vanadium-dependent haloperoxidase [Dyadobacter jejuensis]PWJ60082.1 PAP2 superfamily protein [Dyadobacter jejuensis]